jgi:hypothetical protein
MKQADIVKIVAVDFETKNVDELNKLLKAKDAPQIRYKFTGKKLGALGFTGIIKAFTAEGVKVFNVNKVTLIKFIDIEKFEKAKPKVVREKKPKAEKVEKVVAKKPRKEKFDDEDEDDDFDDEDSSPKNYGQQKYRPQGDGRAGSKFIPNTSKKGR